MNFYLKNNVFDEALNRIRFLFDEFPNIVVSVSGGKDSTVVFNLALKVAEEKGRLPLNVLFIDQEAEWNCVIDNIKKMMYSPMVNPMWMQIPFELINATSEGVTGNISVWDEEHPELWIREKDDVSYKENIYGERHFYRLFNGIIDKKFNGERVANIGGIRCEESPMRRNGITNTPVYKYITWGKKLNKEKEQFTFYPLYDWSYTDVWKAIRDNKWEYCRLYDYFYQHGVPLYEMRVSNVHHETAVKSLYIMQEIEPELWEKITAKIQGINTAGMIKRDAFSVSALPSMFESWEEYRDYLLEKLIIDEKVKEKFLRIFNRPNTEIYKQNKLFYDNFCRVCCNAVLRNDFEETIIKNFLTKPEAGIWIKWKKGKTTDDDIKRYQNKYYVYEQNRCNQ